MQPNRVMTPAFYHEISSDSILFPFKTLLFYITPLLHWG